MDNALYFGDNLEWLQDQDHFPDASVDLIYLDPPFNSSASYNKIFNEPGGQSSRAQIRAFDDTWDWSGEGSGEALAHIAASPAARAAELIDWLSQGRDKFYTNMAAYLAMVGVRLVEMKRVLKPTGSIYLHCDSTAGHYLKLLLDIVFGPTNFRNQIIWRRTNTHNDPKRYGRIHDMMLFYQKGPGAYFKRHFTPLAVGHIEGRFTKEDAKGTYKLENPTGPGPRFGDSGQPWRGFNPTDHNRAWAPPRKLCERLGIDNSLPTREKLDALLELGFIELPKSPGRIPMVKVYLEDGGAQGTPYQDVWAYQPYTQGYYGGGREIGIDQDVAWIGPTSGERQGYPTQKPLGLLRRIIQSSCPADGTVLDPFCGCGTTVVAAHGLKRRWIGIDVTYLAIDLIEARIGQKFPETFPGSYEIYGRPKDQASARRLMEHRNKEFEIWAVTLVGAHPREHHDGGADGVYTLVEGPGTRKVSKVIVQIKGGKNLNPGMVRDLIGTLENESAVMGLLVTL